MRKLILKMSMSLDGFVGSPTGELAWVFRGTDPAAMAWTVDAISQMGLHIMGSRTFRDMAAYWPTSTEAFAPPMNQIPKVVFSKRGLAAASSGSTTRALEDARAQAPRPLDDPGSARESWAAARVASGDLGDEINRLKQEPGRDIMAHGGASFAQSLIERGLIDEYRLLVHPVVLGRGLPIFSRLAKPAELQLVEAKVFPGGTVAHIYRPRG